MWTQVGGGRVAVPAFPSDLCEQPWAEAGGPGACGHQVPGEEVAKP